MSNDLRYEPPTSGYSWLNEVDIASCLVVGVVTDDDARAVEGIGARTRHTKGDFVSRFLHAGSYAFEIHGRWQALVCLGGREPVGSAVGRSDRVDDMSPLVMARHFFESEYGSAAPFLGSCPFRINDMVRRRGDSRLGRVTNVQRVGDRHIVSVTVDGNSITLNVSDLERLDGDPNDPEWWIQQEAASASQLARTLTFTKLRHPLTDFLYSYAATKTVFRPYQFLPVLKLLNSSTGRLLIADEVGLGKTIEAGLIWTELEQREPIRRALVVAPSSLVVKWQREMERRFMRELPRLKPVDLAEFARGLSNGLDPELVGVISVESLRNATEVLGELAKLGPDFQLVIVDEAHTLRNIGTRSYALGGLLSDWADYLIFLSATPLNLHALDLFNLLHMLSEADFGDRQVFPFQLEPNQVLNRVARMLSSAGGRSPSSALEQLRALSRLTLGASVMEQPAFRFLFDLLTNAQREDRLLSVSEAAEARRYLSELNTLSNLLTRTRKAEVPDKKAIRVVRNIDVDWTDAERDFYDKVLDYSMARAAARGTPPGFALQMPMRQAASCIPAMQRRLRERHALDAASDVDDLDIDDEVAETFDFEVDIAGLLAPIPVDSKFEALVVHLRQLRSSGLRQVMIFSFFRRTLEYLDRKLSPEFSVRVMHGKTKPVDRQGIMDAFRDAQFDILLVSEVGSEGLDFEFCNVLVNYDLPWNPMRVEQRIGRLDRFGQEHEKIFILNMHIPGTIETDIFERLYSRIGLFESSIGDLEAILREDLAEVGNKVLDPRLSSEQRRSEADRLALAIEMKRGQLATIEESRGVLSTVDQLEIDGMSDEGPSNGRFIGKAELKALVECALQRHGGEIRATKSMGIFELRGTPELLSAVRDARSRGRGRMDPYRQQLAAALRDGTWTPITFESDVASKRSVDLITGSHDLVKVALNDLAAEELDLAKWGAMAVPGLPGVGPYLVSMDLVESNGVRSRRELWATAIDITTGAGRTDLADTILTALAEGNLQDWTGSDVATVAVESKYHQLQGVVADRLDSAGRQRFAENEALVRGRLDSQLKSISIKKERTRATIADQEARGVAESTIRMARGRLLGLDRKEEEVQTQAQMARECATWRQPVAILLCKPA